MKKFSIGVFRNKTDAEEAIKELREQGFKDKEISVVMQDPDEAKRLERSTGKTTGKAAGAGALTGAGVGGLAGLAVGLTVVPGGFIIGGPIAVALGLTGAAAATATGITVGTLTGGIVGALTGLGLSETAAKTIEQELASGAVLVSVPVKENMVTEEIFMHHDARHVETVQGEASV